MSAKVEKWFDMLQQLHRELPMGGLTSAPEMRRRLKAIMDCYAAEHPVDTLTQEQAERLGDAITNAMLYPDEPSHTKRVRRAEKGR